LNLGADFVSGCFETEDVSAGAQPMDPDFIQQCIDAVNCARAHGCAYGEQGAAQCYCGSNSPDTCAMQGPAKDAACVKEWVAATRGASNDVVQLRFTDLTLPSGWAFYLLECDRDLCKQECVPASQPQSH
jgi:hypothetical protein